MKQVRYKKTVNFRVTDALDIMITDLARATHKNESEVIRDALVAYCSYYASRPHEIMKVA